MSTTENPTGPAPSYFESLMQPGDDPDFYVEDAEDLLILLEEETPFEDDEREEIHAEMVAQDLCPEIHSSTTPGHWALWEVWSEWPDNLLAA